MIGDNQALAGQVKNSDAESREHENLIFAKRVTEIPSNAQLQVDYSGGTNPIYVGYAPKGLATSTGTNNVSGWLIQKFTYDGNNNPTARQISYGSWNNRASLNYT